MNRSHGFPRSPQSIKSFDFSLNTVYTEELSEAIHLHHILLLKTAFPFTPSPTLDAAETF